MKTLNKNKQCLAILVLGLLTHLFGMNASAQSGYAGFNIGVGQGYGMGKSSGDEFDTGRLKSIEFVSIGTTHKEGMFLGFRSETQTWGETFGDAKQTSVGGSIGFGHGGFTMTAHYFWSVERETSTGTVKGTATGYDFGYQFPFFYKNFLTMGLQYSVRDTSFDNSNSTQLSQEIPMFVLSGNF